MYLWWIPPKSANMKNTGFTRGWKGNPPKPSHKPDSPLILHPKYGMLSHTRSSVFVIERGECVPSILSISHFLAKRHMLFGLILALLL